MKFCTITPTRGDREPFIHHMLGQMKRQTIMPDECIIVDYEPKTQDVPDIVPRVRKGVQEALNKGFEYAFIIEDDDYYPDNYFESMLPYFKKGSFVGMEYTLAYRLIDNTYRLLTHPGRSSLYCTAFKLSEMVNYNWCEDERLYFDIDLWNNIPEHKKALVKTVDNFHPVSVKHGYGYTPGDGHESTQTKWDEDVNGVYYDTYLRTFSKVFYNQIKKKIT